MEVFTQPASAQPRASRGERTRQEILAVAVQIASAEGLEDLTIGRLAEELGMSKSGLFAHFGSKEDLQLATIETAREIFIAEVINPALSAEHGLPRLYALFESWISYMERGVFRGGCFFDSVAVEFDGRPGPIRDRIFTLMNAWFDGLVEEVRRAQSNAQLISDIEPAQLAFEFQALGLAVNWAHQLLGDEQAFDRARAAMHRFLGHLATPKGRKLLPSRAKPRKKAKK
jgi:AcrR family transcriptional regulator